MGLGIDNPCGVLFWVWGWISAWGELMAGIFGILESSATQWYQDFAPHSRVFFFIVTSIVYVNKQASQQNKVSLQSFNKCPINFLSEAVRRIRYMESKVAGARLGRNFTASLIWGLKLSQALRLLLQSDPVDGRLTSRGAIHRHSLKEKIYI